MSTIIDNAICIRRWDFSETSQTVSLLTREHGVLRGLAKGAKRERGAFSGGIDLLTRGQIVAITKPEKELATLTQWTLEEVFRAVHTCLPANRMALYGADLIHHFFHASDPHPALFDAFVHTLREMDRGAAADCEMARFQWLFLREAGYRPELTRDAETGRPLSVDSATLAFSAEAGGVVEDTGRAGRWRVRRETIDLLRTLDTGGGLDFADHDVIGRVNRLLASYIREILGHEPATLRWAFGNQLARPDRAE